MASDRNLLQGLRIITEAAGEAIRQLWETLTGSPEQRRSQMLDQAPEVIGYFTDAATALAADYYDESREEADAEGRYVARPVDTNEEFTRDLAWATQPGDDGPSSEEIQDRIAKAVQLEIARSARETIRRNNHNDPQGRGWRRLTHGDTCKFCRMLASRGAVFKRDTARFAAHTDCDCTAQPVFKQAGVETYGDEADAMQYVASKRRRTRAQRQALRKYLNEHFPDDRG